MPGGAAACLAHADRGYVVSHKRVIAEFVICPAMTHCARAQLFHSRDTRFVSGREELLETARRHVREGAERVARQEELVAWLDQEGTTYASQTALAREILMALHASLELMRDHLRRIEGKSDNKG